MKSPKEIEEHEAKECLKEIWYRRTWYRHISEIQEIAGDYNFDAEIDYKGKVRIHGRYGCYWTNLNRKSFIFGRC